MMGPIPHLKASLSPLGKPICDPCLLSKTPTLPNLTPVRQATKLNHVQQVVSERVESKAGWIRGASNDGRGRNVESRGSTSIGVITPDEASFKFDNSATHQGSASTNPTTTSTASEQNWKSIVTKTSGRRKIPAAGGVTWASVSNDQTELLYPPTTAGAKVNHNGATKSVVPNPANTHNEAETTAAPALLLPSTVAVATGCSSSARRLLGRRLQNPSSLPAAAVQKTVRPEYTINQSTQIGNDSYWNDPVLPGHPLVSECTPRTVRIRKGSPAIDEGGDTLAHRITFNDASAPICSTACRQESPVAMIVRVISNKGSSAVHTVGNTLSRKRQRFYHLSSNGSGMRTQSQDRLQIEIPTARNEEDYVNESITLTSDRHHHSEKIFEREDISNQTHGHRLRPWRYRQDGKRSISQQSRREHRRRRAIAWAIIRGAQGHVDSAPLDEDLRKQAAPVTGGGTVDQNPASVKGFPTTERPPRRKRLRGLYATAGRAAYLEEPENSLLQSAGVGGDGEAATRPSDTMVAVAPEPRYRRYCQQGGELIGYIWARGRSRFGSNAQGKVSTTNDRAGEGTAASVSDADDVAIIGPLEAQWETTSSVLDFYEEGSSPLDSVSSSASSSWGDELYFDDIEGSREPFDGSQRGFSHALQPNKYQQSTSWASSVPKNRMTPSVGSYDDGSMATDMTGPSTANSSGGKGSKVGVGVDRPYRVRPGTGSVVAAATMAVTTLMVPRTAVVAQQSANKSPNHAVLRGYTHSISPVRAGDDPSGPLLPTNVDYSIVSTSLNHGERGRLLDQNEETARSPVADAKISSLLQMSPSVILEDIAPSLVMVTPSDERACITETKSCSLRSDNRVIGKSFPPRTTATARQFSLLPSPAFSTPDNRQDSTCSFITAAGDDLRLVSSYASPYGPLSPQESFCSLRAADTTNPQCDIQNPNWSPNRGTSFSTQLTLKRNARSMNRVANPLRGILPLSPATFDDDLGRTVSSEFPTARRNRRSTTMAALNCCNLEDLDEGTFRAISSCRMQVVDTTAGAGEPAVGQYSEIDLDWTKLDEFRQGVSWPSEETSTSIDGVEAVPFVAGGHQLAGLEEPRHTPCSVPRAAAVSCSRSGVMARSSIDQHQHGHTASKLPGSALQSHVVTSQYLASEGGRDKSASQPSAKTQSSDVHVMAHSPSWQSDKGCRSKKKRSGLQNHGTGENSALSRVPSETTSTSLAARKTAEHGRPLDDPTIPAIPSLKLHDRAEASNLRTIRSFGSKRQSPRKRWPDQGITVPAVNSITTSASTPFRHTDWEDSELAPSPMVRAIHKAGHVTAATTTTTSIAPASTPPIQSVRGSPWSQHLREGQSSRGHRLVSPHQTLRSSISGGRASSGRNINKLKNSAIGSINVRPVHGDRSPRGASSSNLSSRSYSSPSVGPSRKEGLPPSAPPYAPPAAMPAGRAADIAAAAEAPVPPVTTPEKRFFKDLADLQNFEPDLKHKIPIGLYEFDFLRAVQPEDTQDKSWDLAVKKGGLRIYKKIVPIGDSDLVMVKGYCAMDGVPAEWILYNIRETNRRKIWDKTFDRFTLVEDSLHDNEIVYNMIPAPWPVVNRDILQWRRTVILPNNTIMILHRSAEHPAFPEDKTGAMIRAESIISGYVIKPRGPNDSDLFLVAQTDIRGSIPRFVVNATAARAPVGWVENLRKACQESMQKTVRVPVYEPRPKFHGGVKV